MVSSAVSLMLLAATAQAADLPPAPLNCATHVETEHGWTTTASAWPRVPVRASRVELVAPIREDALVSAVGWTPVIDSGVIVAFEASESSPSTLVIETTGELPAVPAIENQWLESTHRVPVGGRLTHNLAKTKDPLADERACAKDPLVREAKRQIHRGHAIAFAPDAQSPTGLPFELGPEPDGRLLAGAIGLVLLVVFWFGARGAARWAQQERTDDYLEKEFGWKSK